MVARLARRITDPLYLTWLNRNIEDSSVRATVTSMVNQTDAIGEVAGGPGVGAIGTVVSLRAALVAGRRAARAGGRAVRTRAPPRRQGARAGAASPEAV